MTVEAQRPAGSNTPPVESKPPSRPPADTRPPNKPPSKGVLLALDDVLASVERVASRLPDPSDRAAACGVAILEFRVARARAAVADLLQYSGRDGKAAAAVSRPVEPPAATQGSAGERLAPGSGAAFSGAVTESDGAVVAPIAGAYLPAGRPPLPGGAPGPIGFWLPRDVRMANAIAEALARRAD